MAGQQKIWQKAVILCSNISATLALLVGGGFYLGRYLDNLLKTEPLFTVGLMLVGLVLGGSYLVITLMKLGASDDKE